MAELVELTTSAHGELKLDTSKVLDIAKNTHIMSLRVTEVSRAICELPVFMTKSGQNGEWLISAVTSFEMEGNLLVRDGNWHGTYQPTAMQTYPFYLMKHPTEEKQYTIGIDEENPAFSKETGEALFDDSGKAGMTLSRATAILQDDLKNDVHTYQFCKMVEELELIKEMDVVVTYEGGKVNTLKGLHTIDEAKLAELTDEQFKDLREKGYLPVLYSMLISLYQLNKMIQLHNEHSGSERVREVSMAVSKQEEAA